MGESPVWRVEVVKNDKTNKGEKRGSPVPRLEEVISVPEDLQFGWRMPVRSNTLWSWGSRRLLAPTEVCKEWKSNFYCSRRRILRGS